MISTFAADMQNKNNSNLPNNSKIAHGKYHVSTTYGWIPNEHNQEELYPQSFPLRTNVNFVKSNKNYDQTHPYDKLMNQEIDEILKWQHRNSRQASREISNQSPKT